MSEKKKRSVVLPSDTRVEAEKYETYVPRISADLAVSILSSPPDPLEMGVTPPYGSLADFKHLVALDNRKIKRLREKVDKLLKKYEED
jgi:hypothetical protein